MKEDFRVFINIKRLFFILCLGLAALMLSILPKEKKTAEGKKYLFYNTPGNTALIPAAHADDAPVGITSSAGASTGSSGGGK